jgi:hypothetical protein
VVLALELLPKNYGVGILDYKAMAENYGKLFPDYEAEIKINYTIAQL